MKGFEPCCAVSVAMCAVQCGLRSVGVEALHMGQTSRVQKNPGGDKLDLKADKKA